MQGGPESEGATAVRGANAVHGTENRQLMARRSQRGPVEGARGSGGVVSAEAADGPTKQTNSTAATTLRMRRFSVIRAIGAAGYPWPDNANCLDANFVPFTTKSEIRLYRAVCAGTATYPFGGELLSGGHRLSGITSLRVVNAPFPAPRTRLSVETIGYPTTLKRIHGV